jgi:hypothetical protein
VPLRIGVDLDGVLADMDAELLKEAEILFGDTITRGLKEPPIQPAAPPPARHPDDPPDNEGRPPEAALDNTPPQLRVNMTPRQQQKLWQHVSAIEDFWERLAELEPGVVERLGGLAIERRWEIIFLTKRPATAGSTAQRQTQRWLEAKGFQLPSVFVVQRSRGKIAAAFDLDVVVDDRPENCLDVVVDSRARAILVWREHETTLPPAARRSGIAIVGSTAEGLEMLTKLDSPAARPGLIERVKKLLQ